MKLFYTEVDNCLFWISGYDVENNNSLVTEFTKSIISDAERFAKAVGCDISKVHSFVINHSRRYKYMRVFYISRIYSIDSIPNEIYFIEKITPENKAEKGLDLYSDEQIPSLQWTMRKWLSD